MRPRSLFVSLFTPLLTIIFPIPLLLIGGDAGAQIRADATAPAVQRPTILQAGNGVPLVNIQTPSADGIGASVGIASGNGVAGAAGALNVDANNRQLHPYEYQLARDNAKLVAKKLGITEDEAEGRIVRQLQRNVDGATAQQDAGRRDEPIISILGCGLLKCDAKNTDANYWNSAYNAEYIKPNQSSYDKGVAQSSTGLTPQQIEERNNRAGAPIAKAGAVVFGGAMPSLLDVLRVRFSMA